jgi:hypothetical protein
VKTKHLILFITLSVSLVYYAQPGPPGGGGPPGNGNPGGGQGPGGGGPPGPGGGGPPGLGGGDGGGGGEPCWPPPCIPVDGGIVFLIAIGAAYGTKKAYDQFSSSKTE